MLTRSFITTLLQTFFELLLYSQVIFESMKVADNIFERNSEYEWVKQSLTPDIQLFFPVYMNRLFDTIRQLSIRPGLNPVVRSHLCELLFLRGRLWNADYEVDKYFKAKTCEMRMVGVSQD